MSKKNFRARIVEWPRKNKSLDLAETPSAPTPQTTTMSGGQGPEYVFFQDRRFKVVCRLPEESKVRLCIRNLSGDKMITRDVPESETCTASVRSDLSKIVFH